MFSRTAKSFVPPCTSVRGMATLKEIRMRLKSVKNIQKITKSMKMVSAAKYSKAERELKPARAYGGGATAFFQKAEVKQDDTKPNHLIIACTSDRGLCGAVHASIIRMIKNNLAMKKPGTDTKLVLIGDKGKAMMQKIYGKSILLTFNDIGKRPVVFLDASKIASQILDQGYKFDHGTLYYNWFKSVISYRTKEMPIFSEESISRSEKLPLYDSLDEEVLRSYNEFAFVSQVFYALKEGACSEQSARMTAMDAASKNAGDMISKLTLTFNRTRQAVITRELIEIISGASAL
ncbi:hypothetical protein CHS0354_021709 [Potamilus streckersoni]|uniref:ATP synthase subunit gamma n=1 Tax=Potamilus streckersoni TaxID=2493646 RepID=A0AAE0WGL6_9BIVA|nr:hypothetical protein CHS0354_021709 [Potamilus streckersoni]